MSNNVTKQAEELTIATKTDAIEKLADNYLADADRRISFQHEYTLQGFKTLTLLEGGAIIGLLTYAGNTSAKIDVSAFAPAFGCYATGLFFAVTAYLFAYANQGAVAEDCVLEARRLYGLQPRDGKAEQSLDRNIKFFFGLGLGAVLLSLSGFIAGSWFAMSAIF